MDNDYSLNLIAQSNHTERQREIAKIAQIYIAKEAQATHNARSVRSSYQKFPFFLRFLVKRRKTSL
jgi:hypothetical protein